MAVIHIPEEEAVKNFSSVLSRLDEGADVVIDRPLGALRLLPAGPSRPLTFTEALDRLSTSSASVIDEDFEHDAAHFRARHKEDTLTSEWD